MYSIWFKKFYINPISIGFNKDTTVIATYNAHSPGIPWAILSYNALSTPN